MSPYQEGILSKIQAALLACLFSQYLLNAVRNKVYPRKLPDAALQEVQRKNFFTDF